MEKCSCKKENDYGEVNEIGWFKGGWFVIGWFASSYVKPTDWKVQEHDTGG